MDSRLLLQDNLHADVVALLHQCRQIERRNNHPVHLVLHDIPEHVHTLLCRDRLGFKLKVVDLLVQAAVLLHRFHGHSRFRPVVPVNRGCKALPVL
ncbi:hypothetical protein D3C81_2136870 [compost metagenome]